MSEIKKNIRETLEEDWLLFSLEDAAPPPQLSIHYRICFTYSGQEPSCQSFIGMTTLVMLQYHSLFRSNVRHLRYYETFLLSRKKRNASSLKEAVQLVPRVKSQEVPCTVPSYQFINSFLAFFIRLTQCYKTILLRFNLKKTCITFIFKK